MLQLYIVIVRIDIGVKFDFLTFLTALFLAIFPRLTLSFVEVFAEVHYPTNGRVCLLGDNDEIHSTFGSDFDGFIHRNDTQLLVGRIDQPDFFTFQCGVGSFYNSWNSYDLLLSRPARHPA